MTKPKPKPETAVKAVEDALARESAKRTDGIKPVEIVKLGISAYQSFIYNREIESGEGEPIPEESPDRAKLRRGTQSAVDRMIFNANYWRDAYEELLVQAAPSMEVAEECFKAASVWNTHTLKLNRLDDDEVRETFERFCLPFAVNNRRGSGESPSAGKGPIPDMEHVVSKVASEDGDAANALEAVLGEMKAEACEYGKLRTAEPLDALFEVLPAWCLQNRIDLVKGSWWDDCDTVSWLVERLYKSFLELGYDEAMCRYFMDSCYEAIDAYQYDLSSDSSRFGGMGIPDLIAVIRKVRSGKSQFETDGYGEALPAWLISKEQLIWNVIVCSIFGPEYTRPLLAELPSMIVCGGLHKTDVMTELANASFSRYARDRRNAELPAAYASFSQLPDDLRNSSLAYIGSIYDKLKVLGYSVMPVGAFYENDCVSVLTDSEVECLAILEHRRWMAEREERGWKYGAAKNVAAKASPYMVPWEELPEHAKEWNRSAVRSIPDLLKGINLSIVR